MNAMDRKQLIEYIAGEYDTDIEYLWESTPDCGIFRHKGNRKWFALIMNIRRDRLGLEGEDKVDVLNLKCHPLMHGSLCSEEGIFPAYHMNKQQWISVLLDGTVDSARIKAMLQMSFELTDKQPRPKRKADNKQ